MNENTEPTLEEVDLRPESDAQSNTPRSNAPRPSSTSRLRGFLKKTFSQKKRRLTTSFAESDLIKNNISSPAGLSEVHLSEDDFAFSRNSIQCCPFDITGYGDFILNGEFKVQKPKKMTMMVFMFEKIIIFTTKKKADEDAYYYVGSLKMDHLALMPPNKNKNVLDIKDHVTSTRFHRKAVFSLEAPSEYIQTQWRKAIERCLWRQLLQAKREGGLTKF